MKQAVVCVTTGKASRCFAIAAVLLLATAVSGARAQTLADTDNGRYALSPVSNGVVRLDTRTGVVSTCTDNGTGWACRVVPDERSALDAEIGRLQTDNEQLKAQLAEASALNAGKSEDVLPKQDSLKPNSLQPGGALEAERKIEIPELKTPRIEIPLPSDRDVDRMLAFVEGAWRRLLDLAGRAQRDSSGKI